MTRLIHTLRRYFSLPAHVLVLLLPLLSGHLYAQIDFEKVKIIPVKVTNNIYMLQGAGGNIGVMVGEEGVFLIDDQYAPMTEKIVRAVSELSEQPIRFLLNTHWHGDHTGGNENLGKRDVLIAAHDNVYQRLSNEQHNTLFNRTTPPAPRKAWPVISYGNDMTFHLNGDHLQVLHMPNAHTDGDSAIHFTEANVIHAGDLFFSGSYPYIDMSSGGSIDGIIAGVESLIAIADEKTQIIPGHGPLSSLQDLKDYHAVLLTARDRVKQLIDEGKTEDEVQKEKPLAEYDNEYGRGFMKPEVFLGILYASIKQTM